ncbi:MAG: aminotransferase class V-fold PLP-dependent enzyme, partial [Gemmataceae bacterium]
QVEARILELTDFLCKQAQAKGSEVFSDRSPAARSGIVSLIVPGHDPKEVVQRCRTLKIAVNHRAGRVRVSPHVYNEPAEIERFIASV